MGRFSIINSEYFFADKFESVLGLLKAIRYSNKTSPLILEVLSTQKLDAESKEVSDDELLQCFKYNRHVLQNLFLTLSGRKPWQAKINDNYHGMSAEKFLQCEHRLNLFVEQTKAVYAFLDSIITAVSTIVNFNTLKHTPNLTDLSYLQLFNVGFLPLLRAYGLPLTTFDHAKYTTTTDWLDCHLEYHFVNQNTVLKLISDFFNICEQISGSSNFDHEGMFSKLPRLYSYWGRALILSCHENEPSKSIFKFFENDSYLNLLYKDAGHSLTSKLDLHNFLRPQLRFTNSASEIVKTFSLSNALKFLSTSFCCEKPFVDRYVVNSRDLKSKRNYIYSLGYGLLLETAHIESKRSHIEKNALDAFLATDTLVGLYCHFGLEPIDGGSNQKRNRIGYGKPSQIMSELIHIFLNHVYVFIPKRLDTYTLDIDTRNNMLADRTEKSTLAHEGFFQANLKHKLQTLPNVLHLYKGFKPAYFDLPEEIELDDRLSNFIQ